MNLFHHTKNNRLCKLSLQFLLFLFVIITYTHTNTLAQSTHDGRSWTGYNISQKINDQFSITFTQQIRTKKNFSEFGSFLTNIGLHYKPIKSFKIGLNYRASIKDGNDLVNRIHTDFTFSKALSNRFSFSHRLRYQWEKSILGEYAHLIRPKLTLLYKPEKGKIHPFTATEVNYHLKETNSETSAFKRYRVYGGVNWALSKQHHLKLFYIYQKYINVSKPKTHHIIAALLTVKL